MPCSGSRPSLLMGLPRFAAIAGVLMGTRARLNILATRGVEAFMSLDDVDAPVFQRRIEFGGARTVDVWVEAFAFDVVALTTNL
jgi:hypothetical protein